MINSKIVCISKDERFREDLSFLLKEYGISYVFSDNFQDAILDFQSNGTKNFIIDNELADQQRDAFNDLSALKDVDCLVFNLQNHTVNDFYAFLEQINTNDKYSVLGKKLSIQQPSIQKTAKKKRTW